MPHFESPPLAPAMAAPVVPSKSNYSGIPPTAEEVNSILKTILETNTAQTALDASYALTNLLIQSVGIRGLLAYNLIPEIKKAAVDKKNGSKRESAMFILGAMFERFPREQPLSEVVFLLLDGGLFHLVLDGLADKGSSVRESAQYAVDELFKNLEPEALVVGLLPALQRYLSKPTGKWQGTVGAYTLLGKMADKAQIGAGTKDEEQAKDVLREAMGRTLKDLIPVVESGMHDLKAEVAKAATKAMTSLTTLLQNDDVAPRIPLLIDTMKNPSTQTLQKAIHALSQTTFVAIVTSPVLALLTPLLERALNSPGTSQEVLRQAVVVVENLTKLVHDPVEARTFLPKLQPGVQKVKDNASLPEVRELATRAVDVMKKAMGDDKDGVTAGQIARTTTEDVLKVLDQQISAHGTISKEDMAIWKEGRVYVADMVKEDVNVRVFSRVPGRVGPYLRYLLPDDKCTAVAEGVQKHFVEEDHKKFGAPVQENPDEVEVVNAEFSLAYGGMLLLSHTNLRLLKGHRYGLCGRNGAGKSTLMRSIAEGKLEGFPPQDVLKTCFVEHNQGEDADISILEFVAKDPEIAKEGMERISQVLEEVGFTAGPEGRQSHKVGSLSGGWKMKLALARAMLMRADVLLLDEPTNHLDVANVKWLEEYLKSHTEITSLIVSHDSGFLDAVCTDIYHYEQKKLVHYPGNLADFVKVKPEGKSYYTLSASQVQFKFPPPGILTGVKSNTRSILRMSNVSFTYPGASKPSLQDVSCSLSLSSRVAIIGANGAGKSTLIKLLTGETIPQTGKVEKHPNLRIGYIKQHALEHVEMHLEKTPNQYLQWRYANGDDREVHMKATRALTDEDKVQMEKWIDLGDGKPPRQVEALMGRQKYKKTFQYEVKWKNMLPKFNTQVSRETLLEWGFQKLVQEFDDHEASREGLGYRILEPKVIAKHFEDVGLDPEIANHNQISGLSGGQKVKVVLAGAMWNNPHLLVLDEPTNFLDRDSLGGLAVAIREYKGGVVMISHNEEFVGALCPEQWHVADGRVTHKGHLAVDLNRFEDSRPGSSNVSSAVSSATASAVNSGAEDNSDMNFRAKKKKKMTRAQLKEREVRRRLRHIEWLNSPKGTPHPPDTDDEA
ncbi:[NU+] prion formation protein 1 [Exophiala dermatitidis]|uniref:mRNA-nucleus export ATPase (Elf1) n=2 Tax=Exophiala dermatitidis TaxID=5970 RepID=H6BNS8_EXODN|nr:mRNA-nucleus export ATPase (Elf1) [Exophiala dermatitidis NIH/UT8656]KAJ4514907.1 [NU+] prion formation protein 1 [Exophiala dermatitidis]EHY52263.1 mRNA-nucleus export ATPase (Elf1) [Exophiala dermatitidis NIH/UT8656]KAJ4518377.1 [NU+] prion formation protein 1 [Exophiala dermatitidis]KAJ4521275.1 [NU+] prion formation protein 1 [Exophiala dermatitidis]KAJ4547866.1 [NU+] prion formation protein 1 [Exophiala dermatitidis]